MSNAAPLTAAPGMDRAKAPSALRNLVPLVLRYAFNTLGPISIAGAHFLTSLLFLHYLPPEQFGLFSFAFVVVPFALSMGGALFGAALVNSANGKVPMTDGELAAYMKANLVFAALAAIAIFGLMIASTANAAFAAIVSLYGALMTIRWFARCHAYAVHQMPRAIISDLIYSTILVGGLGVLIVTRHLTPVFAATVLVLCSGSALFGFGGNFLRAQMTALWNGSLRAFLPIWRDLARWSLLGVISTEFTANAHAYLVTLISGPKAFALLALGSLFMRPVSLVMTALPDAERATMARALNAGKFGDAMRAVFQFRIAGLVVLAGTSILAAIIMIWFPHVVLKRGYDEASVVAVLCIWVAIMAIRALRTPESVLLQAGGEFKLLASASVNSSVVSLLFTSGLLFAFGPIVSLGGVLTGEVVMALQIFAQARRWRARHD
jgi:O-antigen/teichoic acid export membrane protein